MDTDGFLEDSPSEGSWYYKGSTLQKILCFLGGSPLIYLYLFSLSQIKYYYTYCSEFAFYSIVHLECSFLILHTVLTNAVLMATHYSIIKMFCNNQILLLIDFSFYLKNLWVDYTPSQINMLKSVPPVPQIVTVSEDKAFKEVNGSK